MGELDVLVGRIFGGLSTFLRCQFLLSVESIFIIMINIENVLRAFFGFHWASIFYPFLPHFLDFDRVQDVQSNLDRLRWDKAASLA